MQIDRACCYGGALFRNASVLAFLLLAIVSKSAVIGFSVCWVIQPSLSTFPFVRLRPFGNREQVAQALSGGAWDPGNGAWAT